MRKQRKSVSVWCWFQDTTDLHFLSPCPGARQADFLKLPCSNVNQPESLRIVFNHCPVLNSSGIEFVTLSNLKLNKILPRLASRKNKTARPVRDIISNKFPRLL